MIDFWWILTYNVFDKMTAYIILKVWRRKI